jgi:hypothetical protein
MTLLLRPLQAPSACAKRRLAGHTVRTQHGVTASAGQRRSDVEIRNYLRDQAGSRRLVAYLSITHDLYGSGNHPLQQLNMGV